MKNREKFREEIKRELEIGMGCSFMRDFVKPKPSNLNETDFCERYSCQSCSKLFAFWLDEEYEEPEVDWYLVPVDTLVRVRDRLDQEWTTMYFKGISNRDPSYRFLTWCDGATSKTASGGDYVGWKYCELVEDEE